MKINSEMRFPHPVLWSETADYLAGSFAVEMEISENAVSGGVKLKCDVVLTETEIHGYCAAKRAALGLSVVCLDTYYNQLHEIPLVGGSVAIPAGQLRGQVLIRPLVWATEAIDDFASSNVHSEFGTGALAFPESSILAIADEAMINVGAEKLAPIGSVFTLALNEDVPKDEVAVQTDEDKVEIAACKPTLEWLSHMRSTSKGKAILLSSVYLPVVITVLDTIRRKDPLHEQKRWYRVFTAKLTSLGLSVESGDLLEVAQTLLKSPLGRLDLLLELTT